MMREHPAMGEEIVDSIEPLARLSPVIRAEHECSDGRGYPDGLSGEEILLVSRIVFACDAFYAMTSDQPYRKAMDIHEALGELERPGRGSAHALSLRSSKSSGASGNNPAPRTSLLFLYR